MSDASEGRRPVRRALISVYDKTGLAELARGLALWAARYQLLPPTGPLVSIHTSHWRR